MMDKLCESCNKPIISPSAGCENCRQTEQEARVLAMSKARGSRMSKAFVKWWRETPWLDRPYSKSAYDAAKMTYEAATKNTLAEVRRIVARMPVRVKQFGGNMKVRKLISLEDILAELDKLEGEL